VDFINFDKPSLEYCSFESTTSDEENKTSAIAKLPTALSAPSQSKQAYKLRPAWHTTLLSLYATSPAVKIRDKKIFTIHCIAPAKK
jgi:hypothetical protein